MAETILMNMCLLYKFQTNFEAKWRVKTKSCNWRVIHTRGLPFTAPATDVRSMRASNAPNRKEWEKKVSAHCVSCVWSVLILTQANGCCNDAYSHNRCDVYSENSNDARRDMHPRFGENISVRTASVRQCWSYTHISIFHFASNLNRLHLASN